MISKIIKSFRNFSTQKLQIQSAEKYVQEKLRSRNWQLYLQGFHYPVSMRSSFYALQLFDLELLKAIENIKQPSLALGRLEFWKKTIDNIYLSEPPNDEPISICLHKACHEHPLTKGYFNRILKIRQQQVSLKSFTTFEQMMKASQNLYGPMLALRLQLLHIQIQSKDLQKIITLLGSAIGLCHYLRRIPLGLKNYKFFVPLDIMSKFTLQTNRIWDRIHGKPAQELFDVVLQIAAFAKKCVQEAIVIYEKNTCPPQSFRAFLSVIQLQMFLTKLQQVNFNIFDTSLYKPNPIKYPYRLMSASKNKKFYVKQ